MSTRRVPILLLCIAAVAITATAILLRKSPVHYDVTFLPSLGGATADAYSINDLGQVLGASQSPAGALYIFLWDQQRGFREIGRYDDPVHAGGLYLNNRGQIAGTIADPNGRQRAFLRDPNTRTQLLGTLGGQLSSAEAINNHGWIVGQAETTARIRHAFVWNPLDGMRDLGTLGGTISAASSINDAGQIVGFSETPDRGTRYVLWDGPPDYPPIDLGDGGIGPFTCEINNRGMVVQRLGTITGKTHFRVWTRSQGSRILDMVAIDAGIPCGLNDANQFLVRALHSASLSVFGHTFNRQQQCQFWDPNDGALILQKCLSVKDKDIAHLMVRDQNIHGQIVGVIGTRGSDQKRTVLLSPTTARR